MRTLTPTLPMCLGLLLLTGCPGAAPPCEALVGSYTGTFAGTLSGPGDFTGTLTLVVTVTSEAAETADLTGTWNGPQGYYGDINRADLNCANGTVRYDYGVALKGPSSVVCKTGCAPGSSSGGCYCTGATLGEFAGALKATGGSGTWKADTGAAQTLSTTGGGTWSVTR